MRTGANGALSSDITDAKKGSGLSTGAKAGIGGGIAGLALIMAGGVLYFCVRQRRRKRQREAHSTLLAMSETSNSKKAGPASPQQSPPVSGQVTDYFDPTATAGPYTDTPQASSRRYAYRGVPVTPQNPGDITAPVEIDSKDHSNLNTPGAFEPLKEEVATNIIELP